MKSKNLVVHMAVKTSVPTHQDDKSAVLYQNESFTKAVAELNEAFIALKKEGENVERVSISTFYHYKKEK